jgi:hypothetical protein
MIGNHARRAGRNVGAGPCACPVWECLIANFGILKTPSQGKTMNSISK